MTRERERHCANYVKMLDDWHLAAASKKTKLKWKMIQEIVDGILDAAIVEEEVAEEDVGFNDLIGAFKLLLDGIDEDEARFDTRPTTLDEKYEKFPVIVSRAYLAEESSDDDEESG